MKITIKIKKIISFVTLTISLTACGGGGGNSASTPDTTPDSFNFSDQTTVALNTATTSNSITVTGINSAATISITNGEYSIDNNAFTSANGTVVNEQTIIVRHTSSSLPTTLASTFLDIGGVSETFTSTTGPIGTGFNQARGFNDTVKIIRPATDNSGDVYVAGAFTTYNGSSSNTMIRLNSDGTVDTAFDVGIGFGDPVSSMSPATDSSGNVYVGGDFISFNGTPINGMIRLNSDGTADTTFDVGSGFNGTVRSIIPTTDDSGDVYVGGFFTTYKGIFTNRVIRLDSDGTQDATFNIGGGFDNPVFSISPAADNSGDVYVGGNFERYNITTSNRMIRLNRDGTVDNGFNVGSGFNGNVKSIISATDGSGDVYVGGWFTSYNGTPSSGAIRLNNDGSVDNTFNVGSGFNLGFGSSTVNIISPATDGSGDVYVGGFFNAYNGTLSNRLIRLNSDGSVDTTFDVGSGFNSDINSISTASDNSGDVYIGGQFASYNGTGSNRMIRLNSNGMVDASFVAGSGFNLDVNSISPAADNSGDMYVGGNFRTYNGTPSNQLIRLNSNGRVDASFVVGSGFNDAIQSISPATDSSGDVYVGGDFMTYNGVTRNRLIRLNSDGSLDDGFEVGSGFDSRVKSISLASDNSGDVYVGGGFTSYNGTASNQMIRLDSNGTVDTAFAIGNEGFNGNINSISPTADNTGDVYAGGHFTSYKGTGSSRVIRLNNDASVDFGFVVGSGFDSTVNSVISATDNSGDVYVGGSFTLFNGTASNKIVRLNSDGSVDGTFDVGSGFDGEVFSIGLATDSSGDVYAGGNFNTYNGTTSNGAIRLNSDGSVDTTFVIGEGFNGVVNSILPATDGSGDVFLGGRFSVYQTTIVDRIVRLNPDGSLN